MDGSPADSIERVYTVLFPFCGIGGGALGFQGAGARLEKLGVAARFKVLGGAVWVDGPSREAALQ